jgi:hypothetical protein
MVIIYSWSRGVATFFIKNNKKICKLIKVNKNNQMPLSIDIKGLSGVK